MFHCRTCLVWRANTDRRSRRLTSQRYFEEVLEDYVVLFAGFNVDFLFMQDNVRPHTAGILYQYLQEVDMPVMEWSARRFFDFFELLLKIGQCANFLHPSVNSFCFYYLILKQLYKK